MKRSAVWQVCAAFVVLLPATASLAASKQSIYIPGEFRNGIYTHPRFTSPANELDRSDSKGDMTKPFDIAPKPAPWTYDGSVPPKDVDSAQ